MSKEEYPTFVCEYEFKGSRWGVQFPAKDFTEAKERLRAMAIGEVCGIHMATIPVALGPFAILVCWIRNAWAKAVRA